MRIIAGKLGRRRILAPAGSSVRPTTDRVRESIFSLLTARLDMLDMRILDLFSGTGALGYEALSRGARHVTFVESNPRVLTTCRRNATALEVESSCTFIRSDVETFVSRFRGSGFDLVFADPPYDWADVATLPDRIDSLLSGQGTLVLEHEVGHVFEQHPGLLTSRKYGRTCVSLFSLPVDIARER